MTDRLCGSVLAYYTEVWERTTM